MIMIINHPNRVVVLATIALVLLVVATVNTAGATADVGSGRQYNKQKYYRGGSVRGVRGSSATNRNRNLKSDKNEKMSKKLKMTKAPSSDTNVLAPTQTIDDAALLVGRDGNATDDLSADEFDDENNSTTIIIDTNFTQEEDDDDNVLGFVDEDEPLFEIEDSNSTTTTTISDITTPVFVRTPISNELTSAVVAADGEGDGNNDASCSAAPLCTRNGLTGDCCPTSEGVYLSCCAKNFGTLPEPEPAPPAPAVVEGEY